MLCSIKRIQKCLNLGVIWLNLLVSPMEYKEYCGFLYGYDKDEGYSILPNNKIERPSTFYKYYALSKNSIEALTNMYVYATHPNQFNDPFDCNEKLVEFDSWDDVRHMTGEKFDEICKLYSNLEDACTFCSKAYRNLLYRKLGIISLATVADNYQMWSLYSENNGLCIEFDVEKFPFKHFGPFPVNYTENVPGAIHIGNDGGFVAMLIQSNIKNYCCPIKFGVDYYSFETAFKQAYLILISKSNPSYVGKSSNCRVF